AEADVRGHATTADLEVVDQEGQRDFVELVGQQLVGETARETHQVVGRDGSGHNYAHLRKLPVGKGSAPGRCRLRWSDIGGEGLVYAASGSTHIDDPGSLAELIADCRELSAG